MVEGAITGACHISLDQEAERQLEVSLDYNPEAFLLSNPLGPDRPDLIKFHNFPEHYHQLWTEYLNT